MNIFKLIFINLVIYFTLTSLFLSCDYSIEKNQPNNPSPILNPDKTSPPEQPRVIEPPWPALKYVWYYKGESLEPNSSLSNCPENFNLDGICSEKLALCQRGTSIYACYPKDLEIRISGKVIDENGLPIRGAHIFEVSSGFDYWERWKSQSKEDGSFLVRSNGICIKLISASLDGYETISGHAHDIKYANCKNEEFRGSDSMVFVLKKINRSVTKGDEGSSEHFCRIRGRVINPQGIGIEAVKINNGTVKTLSDANGYFEIQKQESCDRFCTYRKNGFISATFKDSATGISSCLEGLPGDVILKSVSK